MAIRRDQIPNHGKQSEKAIGLNVLVTGLALTLAAIAAQNPLF